MDSVGIVSVMGGALAVLAMGRAILRVLRNNALDEAEWAVLAEHLHKPQTDDDRAYDQAIDDAVAAIRALKERK